MGPVREPVRMTMKTPMRMMLLLATAMAMNIFAP